MLFRMSLFIEDGEMLFYPSSKDNKTGMTGEEQLKACLRRITYLNKNYANSNYQIIDRESKSEEVLITNYHHEIQQGVLFE